MQTKTVYNIIYIKKDIFQNITLQTSKVIKFNLICSNLSAAIATQLEPMQNWLACFVNLSWE